MSDPEKVFRLVVEAGVMLACIAFLVQAGIVIAFYRLYRASRRTGVRIEPVLERAAIVLEHAEPIADSARKIAASVAEQAPRIAEITQNLAAITKTAREQAAHLSTLLDEAEARATKRIAELDESVDRAVEKVERTGEVVKGAVLKPLREANAILVGVRAGLLTLTQGGRRPSVDHATQDEEMFI
jgi:hypothetical protein